MDTPRGHEQNADQIAYWNGPGGVRWAERQASQDILLAPVAEILIDRAKPAPGERVIDVGCGSGATTIAFGRQVTPKQAPVDYALADATVYPFDPESFDLLASRFGVMFFADPVRSFANLRRALRPTGRLAFACWREPRENPWMMTPLQAVYQHVPKLPQMAPEDPGPFAFASEERVRRILGEAGFKDVALEACPLALDLAIGRGLEAAVQGALEIGPASRALDGHPAEVRAAAANTVRETLARFVDGSSVRLPGSIWLVTARAS
jgi:SAM-dependent methyltransferase